MRRNTEPSLFSRGRVSDKSGCGESLSKGALHVYEENGDILGSIIVDRNQPDEYETIDWPSRAPAEKVMVIHLSWYALKPQGKASAPLSSSMRWKERGNIPAKR